ncbi:3-oxoacyl-[acyl-carrier-protein] synthase III C-terminal domain-containing protein [Aromatoleum diolicum]|nr:3-oxoacyl-[acyl-carrier-protein] synthase III C-terminal domain-containing protein [Aromatoleum diolicum]
MNNSQIIHGVLSTSRYLPRLRLERSSIFAEHRWMAQGLKSLAKGRRTVANWDEDSVTMAVEAARALLANFSGARPVELTLASTTLPFVERINAGIVASALGFGNELAVRDVTSSARAAFTEVVSALRHAVPEHRVILGAERRVARPASTQEMIFGDGAAGVLIGFGPAIATYVASHSVQADFVDHFRESGSDYDYGWEERWVRDEGYMKIVTGAIAKCLTSAGLAASDVAHFAMPAPLSRVNEAVAKRAGIRPEAVVPTDFESVGDLGSAQPLAMVDTALRTAAPGALILVVAFGSGCDALLLRRTEEPISERAADDGRSETSYMKYLSFTGQIALEWGMRAEIDNKTALTAAWREGAKISHFEGGCCSDCGTVQFPRSRVCVNPECRAQDTQDAKSLANVPAHVLSHTSDWLAYTPCPPFQFGHIDFEGGGRVLMEFADTDPDELQVGLPLRMVFRVKDFDSKRGFRRYFWKATPARGQ